MRDVCLGENVRLRIKQFSLMNKFKKKVLRVSFLNALFPCLISYFSNIINCYLFWLQVVADNLPDEQVFRIKEMFDTMDTDNNGQLSFEELRVGLHMFGHSVPDHEVQMLMDAVSLFCIRPSF